MHDGPGSRPGAGREGGKAQTDQPPTKKGDGAAPADDAVRTVEEVVVTARRRDESMQDTPIAVSPFSAEVLEDRQVRSTLDLEQVTPSLQFKPAGQLSGNTAAVVAFIRGVGQFDPTAAVDPGVGIYLDEVYLGRAVGGLIDFGDIAGVEVLRGPQGTLFGRNTIGGAILVRSLKPDDQRVPQPGAPATSAPTTSTKDCSLPTCRLGTRPRRASAPAFRKRQGYVTRAVEGRDLGNDDGLSFNAGLNWKPSDDLEVFVRGDYTKRDENGAPFVFAGINESAPVPAIVSVAARLPRRHDAFPPTRDAAPGAAQCSC